MGGEAGKGRPEEVGGWSSEEHGTYLVCDRVHEKGGKGYFKTVWVPSWFLKHSSQRVILKLLFGGPDTRGSQLNANIFTAVNKRD